MDQGIQEISVEPIRLESSGAVDSAIAAANTEDLLHEEKAEEIEREIVRKIEELHLKGRSHYGAEIWGFYREKKPQR